MKLNCANYLAWSKSIKVVLRAKKKLKFMLEDPLPETTVDYEDWIRADAYVMSWLWHNMELNITSNIQWCETTKQIWTSIECCDCVIVWSQKLPLMFNGVRHPNRFGRLWKNLVHISGMWHVSMSCMSFCLP